MSRVATIAQLLNISTVDSSLLDEATAIAQLSKVAGHNVDNDAELNQWINFARGESSQPHLAFLNNFLADKSYLVGDVFTVADAAVLQKLHADNVTQDAVNLINIRRWLSHVQTLVAANVLASVALPEVKLPLLVFASTQVAVAAGSAAPAAPTPAAAATTSDAKDVPPPAEKKEKKEKNDAKKAETAAPPAAAATPAAASEAVDPSKLDIRVGLVVKCWNHPDSDKLLCEEIDLGEGSHRQIASGIRAFYSAEQVAGRKVLVLANLKERSIAGFKSQGMVLCAATADKSDVKLLEVPESATVGEKVVFTGFSGEPATPAQVAKKKIFETLAPLVRYF